MHTIRHHSRVFASGIILSVAGFAVSINALPPLVTSLADRYAISPGLFGIVFFFQHIAFTLSSSAGGYLFGKERGNPVTTLAAALLLAGVAVGFIGKVPSFSLLIIFMTAIGGLGGIVESTATMILSNSKIDYRHKSSEMYKKIPSSSLVYVSQLFYCLGALVAPMIIGILLMGSFSISLIGLVVGVLTVGIALTVILMTRENRIKRQSKDSFSDQSYETSKQQLQEDGPPLKIFIWFLAIMFLYVMLEASIGNWLPIYLESAFSITPARAAFHLTLFWTGLAGTRFLYIFIPSRTIRTQLAIQIIGIAISVFALLFSSISSTLRSTFVFLLGISCGPIWPLIINLYSGYYAKKNYVMYLVSAGSAGALAGILVTSVFVEFIGIHTLMPVGFVYSLLIAIGYVALIDATKSSQTIS